VCCSLARPHGASSQLVLCTQKRAKTGKDVLQMKGEKPHTVEALDSNNKQDRAGALQRTKS